MKIKNLFVLALISVFILSGNRAVFPVNNVSNYTEEEKIIED